MGAFSASSYLVVKLPWVTKTHVINQSQGDTPPMIERKFHTWTRLMLATFSFLSCVAFVFALVAFSFLFVFFLFFMRLEVTGLLPWGRDPPRSGALALLV